MALARWMLDALGEVKIENCWVPVEGRQMHCIRAGEGPDLVLMHGLLGTASSWEACLPGLTTESTVYAIDALGIGESERVPGIDPSFEAQADRVIQFMDEAHLRNADFVATSHGGAVALTLAARYPARVRNLLLHAPANPYSNINDPLIQFYLSGLGGWFAQRITSLPEQMQALALGRMYGDPQRLRDGSLEKYMTSLRVPGTVEYVLSILRNWYVDMEKLKLALDHVRQIPTLLIWGDRDRAVSIDSAQELLRHFDHAELVELPLTGHVPHDECPELLARVVNEFLVRSRGPRLVTF
jgi:pimeloyl-ACP methyl ester carboxylesterase